MVLTPSLSVQVSLKPSFRAMPVLTRFHSAVSLISQLSKAVLVLTQSPLLVVPLWM
jgi:hypothetical protein